MLVEAAVIGAAIVAGVVAYNSGHIASSEDDSDSSDFSDPVDCPPTTTTTTNLDPCSLFPQLCGYKKSKHAAQRQQEGRNVPQARNYVLQSRNSDIFIQEDGRIIVRKPKGREHIFERTGEHITTVDPRSASSHERLVLNGIRRQASYSEAEAFRGAFRK